MSNENLHVGDPSLLAQEAVNGITINDDLPSTDIVAAAGTLGTLKVTDEDPRSKLMSIIESQPTPDVAKEFDTKIMGSVNADLKERLENPTRDMTEKPQLASYEYNKILNSEVVKALVQLSPNDIESVIGSAPRLESTNGTAESITPDSLQKRTEYLSGKAGEIISKARTQGADLPKFDDKTGEKLADNSLPALRSAVEFLKPKPLAKDYSVVSTVMAFAVSKQTDPEKASKWQPGGYFFEAAFGENIGTAPGQFTRDELIAYYQRMLAEHKTASAQS
jgi:hypothetical protein